MIAAGFAVVGGFLAIVGVAAWVLWVALGPGLTPKDRGGRS